MNFPKHLSLSLAHNEHKNYYETVESWLATLHNQPDWKSDESRAKAIATNEIWTLHWCPWTPVGSHFIAAPTLEELLECAADFTSKAA